MSSADMCAFCHLQGEVYFENDLAKAFLSDPRKVKGHFLVTPKRHVEKPWEVTDEELRAVFKLIYKVEQKLIPTLGTGVDIRQNYRPFLEESRLKIDHIHFHVIPRQKLDHIHEVAERYETVLFEKLTDQEREEIEKLL